MPGEQPSDEGSSLAGHSRQGTWGVLRGQRRETPCWGCGSREREWDSGPVRRDTSLGCWQGAREEMTPAGGGEVGRGHRGRLEERWPRWLGPWGRKPAGLGYGFTCERGWSREVAAACPSLVALGWSEARGTVRRPGGESHKCDFSSRRTIPVQAPSWEEGSLRPGAVRAPEPIAV